MHLNPHFLATEAMYGTGSERRSDTAKTDTAKRKREAGPDILDPQIRAIGAMDEALASENSAQESKEGQAEWHTALATMKRQCRICSKKKENCHFPIHITHTPPCLECQHTWKPVGIKYKGTDLKIMHGLSPVRLLGIRYNMWLDNEAQRRYVMDGITEIACYLQKTQGPFDQKQHAISRLHSGPPIGFFRTSNCMSRKGIQTTYCSFCQM